MSHCDELQLMSCYQHILYLGHPQLYAAGVTKLYQVVHHLPI